MAGCALEPEIAIDRQEPDCQGFRRNADIAFAENNSLFRNDRFERLELDSLEAELKVMLLAEQRALEPAEIVERTLRRFHGDPNPSI